MPSNTSDDARHLSAGDIFFKGNMLKILSKLSKTIQSHDKVKIISLPGLIISRAKICPIRALRKIFTMYFPKINHCFSINTLQDGRSSLTLKSEKL